MRATLAVCLGGLLCLGSGASGRLAAAENSFQDNVVIVLDASGSMKDAMPGSGGSKMAAAKSALKTVLGRLPASTHIGLLVFSARNLRDPWVYPLGPRRDDELTQAIDRLEPYGNTPLGQYIKMGADRLLQERARQFGYGSFRLLVVTDGEAQDQDLVDRYTPDVISRGITMDVIGVAMRQDHTLARKVHSYRRANDPASLERAVAEVMAEVSRSRTDAAQSDDFALIAAIPAEVAAAAIQALSTSGNQPIGERPRIQPPAPAPADGSGPANPSGPAPALPPARSSRGGFPGGLVGLLIFIFILVGIVKRIARGGRR